ncbi:IS1 family transposase [Spirosoma utsteinense]|uniref:IS1 family transposase n=1 Tax=Spirosoma utsteinense TaxID=2585773 RepID=UPI003743E02C
MSNAGPPGGLTYKRSGIHAGFDGRPLPWVEDHDTGEIVAFLFGRRTNASFRRLLKLLAESGVVVSRWFTDYWCGAARAGLS